MHFADKKRADLRPICGEWNDDVALTTLARVVTCPECVRLLRGLEAARPRDRGVVAPLGEWRPA